MNYIRIIKKELLIEIDAFVPKSKNSNCGRFYNEG
jgi:hypothetical protein